MENVWSNICQILAQVVENAEYQVWLAPLMAEFKDGRLTVFARNEFVAGFVRKLHQANILKAASEVLGHEPELAIVAGGQPAAIVKSEGNIALAAPEGLAPVAAQAMADMQAQAALPLRWSEAQKSVRVWKHSFDNFVVGPCNELAHAAARNLCDKHSCFSDVLYLCSGPGLGKTHLVQSVGAALAKASNFSAPRIEYLTAEEFSTSFRQALRGNEIDRFKARLREADVLLLEDIHFLQDKEKTQDEVLATVSALLDRGGKVVFSSSFAPRELRKMDSQLLSRLGSGMIAAIERPDAATRRRIISSKASFHQVALSDDIADYLAENMRSDIRQIEGCLHNLALKARLFNRAVTMDMVRETIAAYTDGVVFVTLADIVRMVCEGFGISQDSLGSKSRKQDHVQARNAAFYLARKHTDLSLQDIGRNFNRTHSTVIKGITSLEHEMSRQSHSGRQLAKTIGLIERNGNFPANAPQ